MCELQESSFCKLTGSAKGLAQHRRSGAVSQVSSMLILWVQGEGRSDPPGHGDAKLSGVIETWTQNASESVYDCRHRGQSM